MFIPDVFAETDEGVLFDLIEAHPFGVLVTTHDEPFATHLPFVLDRERRVLEAHMARANPHWRGFGAETPALVVFHGPHAYVSPTWYVSDGPAVPTWNYAAVHVTGTPRIVDDPAAVRAQQDRLVAQQEENWRIAGQPEKYVDAMLRGIVAFELPIDRLEGKFKLSQNRPVEDRAAVRAALAAADRAEDRATAALMAARGGG